MTKKNSIIFDLDGTLWDTTKQVTDAWNSVLNESNKVSHSQVKSYMGKTGEEIAKLLLPETPIEDSLKILTKCEQQELDTLSKTGGILYPKLEETLKELVKKYSLFIVSNCQKGYIEMFLEKHHLGKYFIDFECPGNTGFSKAKNIDLIMQRNSIMNSVYIGDTQGDCNASRENNIPFIYASYGFGYCDKYQHKLDNFPDLISLISNVF